MRITSQKKVEKCNKCAKWKKQQDDILKPNHIDNYINSKGTEHSPVGEVFFFNVAKTTGYLYGK